MKKDDQVKEFGQFDEVIQYWEGVNHPLARTFRFLASRMKTMAEHTGFRFDWDTIPDEEEIEEDAVD